MEENLSWKIIFVGTIFSLLILGIAYYLISPQKSSFFNPKADERLAEFSAVTFSGFKEGKRTWEFSVESGWTAPDKETTYLTNLHHGTMFQNGEEVVMDLISPKAKALLRSEIIEVFSPLSGLIELEKLSHPDEKKPPVWSRFSAGYLRYMPREKRSELRNGVQLQKPDSSLFAQEIIVDHNSKIAHISRDIKLTRKDAVLTCDNLQYFSQEQKMIADGNLHINVHESDLDTKLSCQHAEFFSQEEKDMFLSGNLEMVQNTKMAVAQEGIYSPVKKELQLKKRVNAIFEKGQSVIKTGTAQKLKNAQAKELLKEKTLLSSDELVFSTRSGDALARGSVLVSQKGKEAKADTAQYNDEEETISLSGNVYMKKGDTWVKARQVLVSVNKETFKAIGAVEAQFNL